MSEVVIVGTARTPIGSFLGNLSTLPASKLGAVCIGEALKRAGVDASSVDEVLMGNVLSAGMGQAPARQACLYAGLSNAVRCATVNKVCGSGLKTVGLGANTLLLNDADVIVAGGMESMSMAPYALPKARSGMRLGHQKVLDLMIHDGLWDPYNNYHMGNAAELCVKEYGFKREAQDEYAVMSYKRAQDAIQKGKFKDEIVSVGVNIGKGKTNTVDTDEEPTRVKFDKVSTLKPAFLPDGGSITAANASTINDGAAAVVLMRSDTAKELGCKPIARILGQAEFAQAPEWFTTAPTGAIRKLLEKVNLTTKDIDLWEINEAFSVVTMAAIQELELNNSTVNIHGGAVAMGHPIGASGCRLLVTLIHALRQENKKRGVASLCIGGGEAIAMAIELV